MSWRRGSQGHVSLRSAASGASATNLENDVVPKVYPGSQPQWATQSRRTMHHLRINGPALCMFSHISEPKYTDCQTLQIDLFPLICLIKMSTRTPTARPTKKPVPAPVRAQSTGAKKPVPAPVKPQTRTSAPSKPSTTVSRAPAKPSTPSAAKTPYKPPTKTASAPSQPAKAATQVKQAPAQAKQQAPEAPKADNWISRTVQAQVQRAGDYAGGFVNSIGDSVNKVGEGIGNR